jgi:DNA polymerase-3 subunit delta'
MLQSLIGNESVKALFRRMFTGDRVPRSLLFAGLEGVGKKRFALEVARSFVCRNPQDGEACDQCPACRRTNNFFFPGTEDKKENFERVFFSEHSDVGMVIPYRSNILVGSIRELEREANFRPFEARGRFFIVEDADKMNDAAANALLKTLEEPAATSYIILVTARPESLLQTIRSRCQMVRFSPVPAEDIEKRLRASDKISPLDAPLIARLSAGSIGRALDFDIERYRRLRGSMLLVAESLAGRIDRAGLLRASEEIADAKVKDDYDESLGILQTLLHDAVAIASGADERTIVNIDILPALRKAANSPRPRLVGWISEIDRLRENLSFNVNRKIATDALFMKMASR